MRILSPIPIKTTPPKISALLSKSEAYRFPMMTPMMDKQSVTKAMINEVDKIEVLNKAKLIPTAKASILVASETLNMGKNAVPGSTSQLKSLT